MAVDSERAQALASVWPEVREHVFAYLRSIGADDETANDVCQEVAARVLARKVAFGSADDLTRWAIVAGRNLAIDQWRHQRRRQFVELDPSIAAPDDVAEAAHDRLRLRAVRSSWAALRPVEREALERWLNGTTEPTRVEAVRWAARRHAARARLAAMVDAMVAVLAWLARHLRGRERSTQVAVLAASVAVAGVIAVTTPPWGADQAKAPDVRRSAPVAQQTTVSAPRPTIGHPTPPRATSPPSSPPRPNRAPPSSVVPYRTVAVGTPSGPLVVRTRPQEPDEPLICITNARLLPTPICIEDNIPGLD